MAVVGIKSQKVALLASVLASGCSFFPEQLLLPGEPMTDQDVSGPSRGTMASAVSGAGRGADPAAPRSGSMPSGSTTASSPAAAAGSGATNGSAGSGSSDTSAQMTQATHAGSSATPAAGSGASGSGGEDKPKQATDPTCDVTGVWITKQISANKALEEVGYSNSYAYYELEQSGTDFVVKKHIDCGGLGIGGGTASLPRASLQALTQRNSQSGRKGRFALVDGKCTLENDHFWSVRGADESRYLPNPTRDSTMSLAELQKLKPLPTPNMQDGAEDWDNDGEPGLTTQVDGIISGERHGCQRDWDRWFTAPGYEITPSLEFTTDLTIRFDFESEEALLSPTVGLLATPAEVDYDYDPIMRFHFLGRTTDDPRAQAIVKADPVETCYAIQDASPAEQLTRR